MRQATLQKGCKVGSSILAPQRDAPMWSPAPKGSLTRSEELQKVHLTTSDASVPEPLHLGGGKIRGSSEVGQQGRREVSRLAGKAKRRRRAKSREEGLARPRLPTPPPGSRLRGELRRCPLDGRREGHSRPKCLRPRSSRRRRCC